jgi:hypothetical protein
MFRVEIKTGNDAMQTAEDLARALRDVADRIEQIDGYIGHGRIRDENGNTVGTFDLSES